MAISKQIACPVKNGEEEYNAIPGIKNTRIYTDLIKIFKVC
jgi:hypothetical protein